MNGLDREIQDTAAVAGQRTFMNAEEIADALMYIAEAFGASVAQLQEALMIAARATKDLTMSPEEFPTMINCLEPRIQETKPEHKLCLNRPRIAHQVCNRKPRNLIKKIIR